MKMSFKRIALIQCAIVLIACAFGWLYVANRFIHTPVQPHEEYYTHSWEFQMIVGAIHFVGISAITALVILVEYLLVRSSRARKASAQRLS
jgi:hypothetical protein